MSQVLEYYNGIGYDFVYQRYRYTEINTRDIYPERIVKVEKPASPVGEVLNKPKLAWQFRTQLWLENPRDGNRQAQVSSHKQISFGLIAFHYSFVTATPPEKQLSPNKTLLFSKSERHIVEPDNVFVSLKL